VHTATLLPIGTPGEEFSGHADAGGKIQAGCHPTAQSDHLADPVPRLGMQISSSFIGNDRNKTAGK